MQFMIKILQIIILVIISLLMMSASCDKGSEGCTNTQACNYDETAAIDDNSCWFVSTGCDCEDPPGSVIDCLGICDADILNDPDEDADGNCCSKLDEICNIIVIGGCKEETNCKFSQDVTHNDGSCSPDLIEFGGTSRGCDCTNLNCDSDDAACGGLAVMDGCENQNCIGGILNIEESWKIIIHAKATFKSVNSDTLLGIDSSKVILGVSEFALDGYNNVEQEGGNSNCSDSCYVDIFEPASGLRNNSIRFYFPHDEWLSELNTDIFIEPNFVQDIRYYNLQTLFPMGIQWNAIIEPINLTYGAIIDAISISYEFEGAIYNCIIKVIIDGLEHELDGSALNQFNVNSNQEIYLSFNISNICFDEFQ